MEPTVSLNLCYLAMTINDKDGNEKLDSKEYVSFCNQLSRAAFTNLDFDTLPTSLKDKFYDLSNGDSEGINVQGARPTSNSNDANESFLRRICVEVDQAIDQALNSSPPSSPTSLPISDKPVTSPPPTSSPISATSSPIPPSSSPILPTETPVIKTDSPTTQPTSLQPTSKPQQELQPVNFLTPSLQPTSSPQNVPIEAVTNPPSLLNVKTEIPSLSPTKIVVVGEGSETPTVTVTDITQSPDESPSISKGTMYFGNVTFTISNSARLDTDHLQSGKTRNDISLAFWNLTETISERILSQRRLRSLRYNVRSMRNLLSSLVEAGIERIENTTCPSEVPPETLCAECYAMFALQKDESQSTTIVQSQIDTLETDIMTAIIEGKLQQSLDAINPDTPVRIEEGTVRLRGVPTGVFTLSSPLSSTNVTTMAGIGGGVAIVILVLICIGSKCCIRDKGKTQKSNAKRSRSQEMEKPSTKKASGVFG